METLSKECQIVNKLIFASKKHITGKYRPHFHDFYEIEYVIQGGGVCTVNGTEYPCTDGMLFFITPVDYHSVETEGAEIVNIMFSDELVAPRLLYPFLQPSVSKAIKIGQKNRMFLEQIFTEIVENENDEQYLASLMSCLLIKLAQLIPTAPKADLSGAVAKMHSYILSHFQNKMSLADVAAYAGLTPSYASTLFKKEIKVGFKTYLNSLRLEYARKLLIFTELPVGQICQESGFEDVPNFLKRCKVYYGMTPSQIRKRAYLPKE